MPAHVHVRTTQGGYNIQGVITEPPLLTKQQIVSTVPYYAVPADVCVDKRLVNVRIKNYTYDAYIL